MIKRSRWQFSFRVNFPEPPTFVDRFGERGRNSFEAAFAARARRYRRTTRTVIMMLIGFFIGGIAAMNLPMPDYARFWIALPFGALIPLAMFLHLINKWLRCPSCRRRLTPAKGRYCPQCGSEDFEARSRCNDCGVRIEEETGEDSRSYLIRGCTHCGVFLDQQGLR